MNKRQRKKHLGWDDQEMHDKHARVFWKEMTRVLLKKPAREARRRKGTNL